MALTKENKKEIVKDLESKIEKHKSIVFVDFKGTKVKDLSGLRKILREKSNELRVIKKTLANIALKNKNIDVDTRKFEGELGVVFGYEDEVSSSKAVYDFSKNHETVKILGGYLDNKFYSEEDTIKLAQLPSKEQLLAQLVGTMSAPVSNFVGILNGVPSKFVRVLSQIKDNK